MLKRALVVLGLAACSHPKTITSESSIEVYDPIIFASGSDQVPANTIKSIETVAATLTGNPTLLKVSIEAHTAPADAATPADRQALAIRRAQAVLDQLVARGVERGRLQVGTADDGNDGIAIVVLERKGDDGKPETPPAAY